MIILTQRRSWCICSNMAAAADLNEKRKSTPRMIILQILVVFEVYTSSLCLLLSVAWLRCKNGLCFYLGRRHSQMLVVWAILQKLLLI